MAKFTKVSLLLLIWPKTTERNDCRNEFDVFVVTSGWDEILHYGAKDVCAFSESRPPRRSVFRYSLITIRNILLCVAVCCSVLRSQSKPLNRSVFRHSLIIIRIIIMCCRVLQCVAVCCSVLQCVAVCCSVTHSQSRPLHRRVFRHSIIMTRIIIMWWQCVAVCCSVWNSSPGKPRLVYSGTASS